MPYSGALSGLLGDLSGDAMTWRSHESCNPATHMALVLGRQTRWPKVLLTGLQHVPSLSKFHRIRDIVTTWRRFPLVVAVGREEDAYALVGVMVELGRGEDWFVERTGHGLVQRDRQDQPVEVLGGERSILDVQQPPLIDTPVPPPVVGVLTVPGACLHYELRGDGPLVALVGDPMDAGAFAPLAEVLATDHMVLTTDPRGINRSVLDDPEQDSTPELRAEDLSALLAHLDRGPATIVGSSGGAATALALAQVRPDQVQTVVAHEPPMDELLEDRERLHAESEDVIATYAAGDVIGAWTKFFAQANIDLPDEVIGQMFGGERDAQVVADERRWFLHSLRNTNRWKPDIDVLRRGTTHIVIGVGDASAGEACDRISSVLADELGLEPTIFPGDHTAFVEDPEGFAARLRAVLGRR